MFDLLTQLKIYGIQYLGSTTGTFVQTVRSVRSQDRKSINVECLKQWLLLEH